MTTSLPLIPSASVPTVREKDWRDDARREEREEEKTVEWIDQEAEENEEEDAANDEEEESSPHQDQVAVDDPSDTADAHTASEQSEVIEGPVAVPVVFDGEQEMEEEEEEGERECVSDSAATVAPSPTSVTPLSTEPSAASDPSVIPTPDEASVASSCPHLPQAVEALSLWGLKCLSPCLLCVIPQRRRLHIDHLRDARRAMASGKGMASECERDGVEKGEGERDGEVEAMNLQLSPEALLSLSPSVAIYVLHCLLEALCICDHSAALQASILLLDTHLGMQQRCINEESNKE